MPEATALTPYGMTECLAVAAIDLDGIEEAGETGVCVGRPVPRVEIAIAVMDELGATTGEITHQAGEIGEVLVRGPHVRDRYLMLWGTTHTSMRFTGSHAHGDVGRLDADGRLWVEGRATTCSPRPSRLLTPVQVEDSRDPSPRCAAPVPPLSGPAGARQVVVILEDRARLSPPASPVARVPPSPPCRRPCAAPCATVPVRRWSRCSPPARCPPTSITNSKIDRAALSRWAAQTLAGERAEAL